MTGLEVILSTESNQRGQSFGARLSNAISDSFEKGFDAVITIGSDCPFVTNQILTLAVSELQHSDNVVIPDNRGGVCLFGINKNSFPGTSFEHLSWNSSSLYVDLVNFFRSQSLNVTAYAPLADINTEQDLRSIIKSNLFIYIKRVLQLLLSGYQKSHYAVLPHYTIFPECKLNRNCGPPYVTL